MKLHGRGRRGPRFADSAFLEALGERESGGASARRQFDRKTNQFYRQVQRALNLALTDRGVCSELEGLFVEDVLPAPHCGRLLVRVLTPDGVQVTDAMEALGRMAPRLRSEVAAAIARKRAPQLCFVPVDTDRGGDE